MAADCSDSNELLLLTTYIEESDNWLHATLERLGWTTDGLENRKESPHLVQCTQNSRHFVSSFSAASHALRCQYASKGIHLDSDNEELVLSSDYFYKGTCVKSMEITQAVENAVCQYTSTQPQVGSSSGPRDHDVWTQRDFIHQSDVVVELPESKTFASLEDSQPSSPGVYIDPLHAIRFIKSWELVPSDCTNLLLSSLPSGNLRGWLFKNLPNKHTYSSSLGGELQSVETIVHFLSPAQGVDTTTPDRLMEQLVPLLGGGARPFVLSLWKHIYISRVQEQHGISDTTVEELLPLPLALPEKSTPSVLENIQAVIDKNPTWPHTPGISLPMEYVFYNKTPAERLAMYEYVAAVTGRQSAGVDPDLVRDDNMSKLDKDGKGEGQKSYLEVLQEQRDYKRRRQSYRAKNVHITKRTPLQVMRDIIESRMEDIRASLEAKTPSETVTSQAGSPPTGGRGEEPPGGRRGSCTPGHATREKEPDGRYLSHGVVKRTSEASRPHPRDRRRSRSRDNRRGSRDRRSNLRRSHSRDREGRGTLPKLQGGSQDKQPPGGSTAPQSGAGVHQMELEVPQSGSGAPQSGSGAPQSGSGAPQSGSGAPQNGSGAPQSGSGAPQNGSGAPQSGSGAPQSGSGAPQSGSKRSRSKSHDGQHKSHRSHSREGHHHRHHHHHKSKSPSRRHGHKADHKRN